MRSNTQGSIALYTQLEVAEDAFGKATLLQQIVTQRKRLHRFFLMLHLLLMSLPVALN